MFFKKELFKFPIDNKSDLIEIGGGEGDLSLNLFKKGFNITLFVEPDIHKFKFAKSKLKNIDCLNIDIEEINIDKLNSKYKKVIVIMQDVIEHIPIQSQKIFFKRLSDKYNQISFIGRTPNLKSIFGMRNSFGDNSHLYRFTDSSLRDFLEQLEFKSISIKGENYKITGITSLLRFIPYLLTIFFVSLMFLFVFGRWEGFLTPNIVFQSKKIKK